LQLSEFSGTRLRKDETLRSYTQCIEATRNLESLGRGAYGLSNDRASDLIQKRRDALIDRQQKLSEQLLGQIGPW
jgi:hypothetical protein